MKSTRRALRRSSGSRPARSPGCRALPNASGRCSSARRPRRAGRAAPRTGAARDGARAKRGGPACRARCAHARGARPRRCAGKRAGEVAADGNGARRRGGRPARRAAVSAGRGRIKPRGAAGLMGEAGGRLGRREPARAIPPSAPRSRRFSGPMTRPRSPSRRCRRCSRCDKGPPGRRWDWAPLRRPGLAVPARTPAAAAAPGGVVAPTCAIFSFPAARTTGCRRFSAKRS